MSGIPTPALETATGATAEVYAQIKKAAVKVPNTFATIGAHAPAAQQVFELMHDGPSCDAVRRDAATSPIIAQLFRDGVSAIRALRRGFLETLPFPQPSPSQRLPLW